MAERFSVKLTRAAVSDLDEIGDHMAQQRGLDAAEALLERLRKHTERLDQLPLRGPVPKELDGTGRTDIRQTAFGPYRIFYKVAGDVISVFMIADGRRDIETLLIARLVH